MDSFNPFTKLNIYIINANPDIIMIGIERIVVAFNKNEITNYSQFIEKLNDIFKDYGIVESIYNKEGFKIVEFNNLHIDNIWNYITNNDTIQVKLNYQKEEPKENYKLINNFKLKSYTNFNNHDFIKDNSKENSSQNKTSIQEKNKKNKNEIKKNTIKTSLDNNYPLNEDNESSDESNSDGYKYNKISKKEYNNPSDKKFVKKDINNEKMYNDFSNNDTMNKNLLGKKRKAKNHDMKNNTNQNFKNNKINKIKENSNSKNNENIKKLNYELIPSDKLDDISFLQTNYPKLFLQGTNVKFKIQELLKTGIGVGDFHFGVIDNYNPENNSFLIKNCNSLNEKTMLFMYQFDQDDLMSVELKNFVEIWIESEKNGKDYLEKDPELTRHFIRRQVEFYFCDKNYEKDNFLKKNEDDNGFIPLNIIMGFNKIQMITKDKNEFIEALKEEGNENLGENKRKSYEFNQDFTGIRKIK